MNIKTTIVLLILLTGVAIYVFATRDKTNPDDTSTKHEEHTLLDVKEGLVTSFSVKNAAGKELAAAKTKGSDGLDAWKLTAPVKATAETYKVSSLLTTLTGLKSTEQISGSGTITMQSGLDHPQYTVQLTQGGTDVTLLVGQRLSMGDGVYVQVKGHSDIDVVSTSLLDELKKPASSFRKDRLFETAAPSVQQLTITHADGSQLAAEKQSAGWQVTKPQAMPGDGSAIEDLASAVINMQPVEFIDGSSDLLGFNKPQAVVTFSAAAPTTQPTTMPLAMANATKVVFGSYEDLTKQNVFAQTPDGTVVKVPASVIESLNKKPLELRDKSVISIDPAQVTKLIIATHQPATTQPVAAAVDHVVTLSRRPPAAPAPVIPLGPPLPMPTTKPTTSPTSAPTTQPAVPEAPKSVWLVDSGKPGDADDAKVTSLLGDFHPLKAEKYLEQPSTSPSLKTGKVYTVTLFTNAPSTPTVVTLTDPGSEGNLNGLASGLNFEMLRTIATDLGGEFTKSATPGMPTMPSFK